jgi:cyclic beta-1,2-glucan synthetase
MMNPIERTLTNAGVAKYRGEPYVVAADVSSSPGREGTCGWTWYTGSAAWMYRVWLEDVLGFHLDGKRLRMAPVIPEDWPGFEIIYRYGSSRYRIVVERVSPGNVFWMERDGVVSHDNTTELIDDHKEHQIQIRVGAEQPVTGQPTGSQTTIRA